MTTKIKTREALIKALTNKSPKSGEMWEDAQDVIPGGLLSTARRYKPYPFYTQRGHGGYIWDVDGNRYIDCCMSYGSLILGHAPPNIVQAICDQASRGTVYGVPHEMEIEYAKRFIECVPCAERILLCNSGTEATMQGIRMMRAHSGKVKVAKFEGAYHGWHDYVCWSVGLDEEKMGPAERPSLVPISAGIPDSVKDTVLLLPYEEAAFDLIEEHADELAGVMIEPVFGSGSIPIRIEFLKKLREITKRLGLLLMFDEVVTGFRLALGGGQELFDIIPDLATYGKIIGGGLPVGAVGCPRELMDAVTQGDDPIFVAGTFSGNPLTLAVGYELLGYLKENTNIYSDLEKNGNYLRNGFNEWAQSSGTPVTMTGIGSLFQTHFKKPPVEKPRDKLGQNIEAYEDFLLYLRLKGVFVPWLQRGFVSTAHSDDDLKTLLNAHTQSAEAALQIED